MKKILCVTTVPDTLCAFVLPFAHHFRSLGWQVDAMAQGVSTNADCLQTFDRVWEIEWSRNPLQLQNLTVAPRQIRTVVEQEGYDIVHVHTPVAAFVTRYALNGLRQQGKVKLIYTAHGFHFYQGGKPLKNLVFLALEKLAGQWTDYLVVINREDEKAVKQHQIVADTQLCYMPGIGVDFDFYNRDTVTAEAAERVRQELGLTPANPLLVCAAEFIPRKRHSDILRAFARLDRPEVHLALAGDGRLMAQMQQLANELGIEQNVRFLGFRRDIPTLISISAALILVSEQEGLPRCIMESFCLGVPVIGTKIRGTRDLLADRCGLLIDVGDIEALTQAMAWIVDNPEAARIMGERAKERVATYDLRHILKLYESLYDRALGKSSYAVSASR
ncbi:glycosyltransferase family 4 protein [Chroococcidiopsis sp.]|uniref:glycosyltransferase family 4 protein n=1 Tax=Chroococcidiopsis sp. TaxID=3088168 RepID=UPI003F3A7732